MIVIKNVELIETDGDWIEFVRKERQDLNFLSSDYLLENKVCMQKELIKGARFKHPNGEMIIGVTGQAAEILGVMYEVYENMRFNYDANRKLLNWVRTPFLTKLYLIIFDCVEYERIKPKI